VDEQNSVTESALGHIGVRRWGDLVAAGGSGGVALTSDGLRFPRCFAVIFVAGFARAAGPRRREGAGDGESSAAARPCEASRGAGGSDSHHMCMAKRSEPIWKNTVDGGGSSFTVGRVAAGNGSTLLVLFFFFTRPLWHSFRLPDALGDYRVRRIASNVTAPVVRRS
jgi:hypothetical protein